MDSESENEQSRRELNIRETDQYEMDEKKTENLFQRQGDAQRNERLKSGTVSSHWGPRSRYYNISQSGGTRPLGGSVVGVVSNGEMTTRIINVGDRGTPLCQLP